MSPNSNNMEVTIWTLFFLLATLWKTIVLNLFEEFKDCIGRGDEIEFEWKGVHFGMSGCQPKPEHRIMAYLWNQPDTEQYFDTPDDALEYIVAGDRLRDIITQIDVLSRAF